MKLLDLKELCDRYVPKTSRHDRSFDGPDWWPAHELGHLLIAAPDEVGQTLFGLSDSDELDGPFDLNPSRQRYLLSIECAAMTLSARMLRNVGHRDLADEEFNDTDDNTMYWWDSHEELVKQLVADRCPRVPRTRVRLERLLQQRSGGQP